MAIKRDKVKAELPFRANVMLKAPKLYLLIVTVFIFGCAPAIEHNEGPRPCSNEWLYFVEGQLKTSDSQGHGPDLGSIEWRSVIEFKLGIRGDPRVPGRESEQWCSFIDVYIKNQKAIQVH